MSGLYEIVNGKLRLNLHPGQTRAWDSRRRFVFMLAGAQGGKTGFAPWWLAREIYGDLIFHNAPPGQGPGDYLAATSSYDLFKLRFRPAMLEVFEQVLQCGRYWSGDRVIELKDPETGKYWARRASDPMWGRIILRSASAGSGLESATAKAALLDECGQEEFSLETWEAVIRRLSLATGRVLGATTLYNRGWLKSEVHDRWLDGDPDYDVIQFPSYLNPAFPRAEYERAKRTLPEWRFLMFYEGKFAQPAGLIYGDFTDAMLVDPFAIPPDWRRVVGVDPGGANTALVWLAESPEGTWYAYRESLSGGVSTPEHVGAAKAARGNAQDVVFAGGASSETQFRTDWKAAGLEVKEPPNVGVEGGIDRVVRLVRGDQFRVFRTLKGLRDELGTYSRKVDEAGQPTDEIVDKRNFHRLDALRYAVVHALDGDEADTGGFAF